MLDPFRSARSIRAGSGDKIIPPGSLNKGDAGTFDQNESPSRVSADFIPSFTAFMLAPRTKGPDQEDARGPVP